GNAASLAWIDRADLTARRVRGSSSRMTEKAKASGNALDRPTSVWSDMARKYVEPPPTRKANDDRRSPVDASRRCRPKGRQCKRPPVSIAKLLDSAEPPQGALPNRATGLSRPRGIFV